MRLWRACVAGFVGAIAAIEACASRGSPPCEELQADARTACPPADASVELVVVTVAHVDGGDRDVRYTVDVASPF
jgi:hypothetical protein